MSGISVGTTINRYFLIDRIGQGGMGTVYRAFDNLLGRDVAIKILSNAEPESITQLIQEATAASSLNHPNILTVYEAGQHQGQHYLAMEFIDGETVREKISRGPLAIEEALAIATQVAKGLSAAQDLGVVHRDIKPENIIVGQDGTCKILDFGLAIISPNNREIKGSGERLESLPARIAMIGTANYMSPEQVRGDDVDARSDIFSLGVVIYEMLTGYLPFVGHTVHDVMTSILKHHYQPASQLRSPLNPDFDVLIAKSLAKRKEERYQNARELLRALKLLESDNQSPSAVTLEIDDSVTGPQLDAINIAVESMQQESVTSTKFVNRVSELAQLDAIFQLVSHHSGQLVVIQGNTGEGKTMLVEEFQRRCSGRATTLCGRFYEEYCSLPFAAFLDAMGDFLNSNLGPVNGTIFREIFEESAREIEDSLKKRNFMRVSQILQLQGGADQRTRSFEMLRRCLLAIARIRPMIFFFDNLQWADSSTLEAITYLSKNIKNGPIMLVVALRSEELAFDQELREWLMTAKKRENVRELVLMPFGVNEIGALLTQIFPGIEPDPQLLETLFQRTAGNPFFARELILHWQEQGTLHREGEQWRVDELQTAPLLQSTTELIELRIDQLDDEQFILLAQAAVIGNEFDFSLLQQAVNWATRLLSEQLTELVAQRFIDESDKVRGRYIFHNTAIQQSIYRRLQQRPQELRQIHANIAKVVKIAYSSVLESVVPQLAYHYREAGMLEQAFEFSVRSAEQSRRAGAVSEQAKYIEWADIASSEMPTDRRKKTFLKLLAIYRLNVGYLLALRGKLEIARQNLEDALAISTRVNDDPLRGSVQIALGLMYLLATDYVASQNAYAEAISIFERLGDNAQRLEALSGFAISKSFDVKELERASRWLLAVSGNSALAKGYACTTMALAYLQQGLLGHTVDYYLRSVSHLEKAGERAQQARTLSLLGGAYAQRRQFDEAAEYCRRGMEMAAQINLFAELIARNALVPVLLHRGEFDAALETCRQVLHISEQSGNKLYLSMSYLELGRIEQSRRNYQSAIANYRQAVKLFDAMAYRYRQAEADALLGECYLQLGQNDNAILCCRRGIELSRKDRFRHPYWQAALVIARSSLNYNNRIEARSYLREVRQVLDEMVGDLPEDAAASFLADKMDVLALCKEYE